jgi:hypothetical protein
MIMSRSRTVSSKETARPSTTMTATGIEISRLRLLRAQLDECANIRHLSANALEHGSCAVGSAGLKHQYGNSELQAEDCTCHAESQCSTHDGRETDLPPP